MRRAFIMVPVAALTVSFFGASIMGCGKKIDECNQIIKVINPVVEKVKAATADKKGDEGNKMFTDIATAEDGAAADLAKLTITTPELQKYSKDYQDMSKSIAASSRDLADALKGDDDTKRTDALKKFTDANEKEGPIVDGLNKFCTGGT